MQEIEPLTYQKTTNIEEHRQFLAKINEIIDNLAPTVDAAEAAVAEAARALADALAAVASANAAVDAAEAASQGATQAAATVAGYDNRLSTFEQNCIKKASSVPQVIDSDLQIVNGHSLSVADGVDVSGDLTVGGQAEIAGLAIEQSGVRTILSNANGIVMDGQLSLDAMTVAGMTIGKSEDRATVLNNDDPIVIPNALKVRTNAAGTRNDEAVNGTRLQNDLDSYDQMLRTSGNQSRAGQILFVGNKPIESIIQGGWNLVNAKQQTIPSGTLNYDMLIESDPNGAVVLQNRYQTGANNEFSRIYFSLSHVVDGVRRYSDFVFESGLVFTKFYITRQRADGTIGTATIASIGESD